MPLAIPHFLGSFLEEEGDQLVLDHNSAPAYVKTKPVNYLSDIANLSPEIDMPANASGSSQEPGWALGLARDADPLDAGTLATPEEVMSRGFASQPALSGQAREAVPPDGLCLAYACLGARSVQVLQSMPRSTYGFVEGPLEPVFREAALTFRGKVCARALAAGRADVATSLNNGDYPEGAALHFYADELGGSLMISAEYAEGHTLLYGNGPIVAHVHNFMMAGPDGNLAPHYELVQSWLPQFGLAASTSVSEVITTDHKTKGASKPRRQEATKEPARKRQRRKVSSSERHTLHIKGNEFFGGLQQGVQEERSFQDKSTNYGFSRIYAGQLTKFLQGEAVVFFKGRMHMDMLQFKQLSKAAQLRALRQEGVYIYECEDVSELDQGVSNSDTESPSEDGAKVPIRLKEPVLQKNYKAVLAHKMLSCRLTRELGEAVYCIDWKLKHQKPCRLELIGTPDNNSPTTFPATLQAVCGRESGKMYYTCTGSLHSPTANWVLKSCKSKCDTLRRLPLLLTPSYTVPIDNSTNAVVHDMPLNSVGVDSTDGQCEVGLDTAIALGMVKSGCPTYGAWQFRGVVFVAESQESILCKGMLVLNPHFQTGLVLHTSACKVRSAGVISGPSFHYGLDIVASTSGKPTDAKWTPSLQAAILFRGWLNSGSDEQFECFRARVTDMAETCKSTLKSFLVKTSFGHPSLETVDVETSDVSKVAAHLCDVKIASSSDMVETNVTMLCQELPDNAHRYLTSGTRDSLAQACEGFVEAYKHARKEPYGLFPKHTSFKVKAISDPYSTLHAEQCFVVVGGKSLIGKLAMWRYPIHLPSDVVTLEAVMLPSGLLAPDNSIVLSRLGFCNTQCAGGDFDGDDNMVSFWPPLVQYIEATQFGVDELGFQEIPIFPDVVSETFQPGQDRFSQFIEYSCRFKTPNVKGRACTVTEKAQQAVMECKFSEHDLGELSCKASFSVQLGLLAHRAMDVPFKCTSAHLSAAITRCCKQGHFKVTGRSRSSKISADSLRFEIANFNYRQPFLSLERELEGVTSGVQLGCLHLPKHLVLGHEAGVLVGKALALTITKGSRAKKGTVAQEIMKLLRHRSSRKVKDLLDYIKEGRQKQVLDAMTHSQARPISKLASLMKSKL